MADVTLAQDEPYLKQLDQGLKQLNDLHHKLHDVLLDVEEKIVEASEIITTSWPEVTNLILVINCLRANRRAFNREQRRIAFKLAKPETVDQKQVD